MNQPINLLEYEALAPKFLSKMAWDYYASGANDEITLKENQRAFSQYKFCPKVLVDVSLRSLKTTILGHSIEMPVLIAPMAFQCLAHPEGELATVQAAVEMGTIMILSTLSTQSLEAVAKTAQTYQKTNPLLWFQLYVHKDRGLTKSLVERAESAGYQALCLTVDAPVLGRRERDRRNEFNLPAGMNLGNLTNLDIPETVGESGLLVYFAQQLDASLTWKDLEWLQSITKLPIVVKGILRPDDARRAVEHGAKAVIVSNHGGRQLDGTIATIEALSAIVAAVGTQTEVLMDGGIRRGTDVLKALALGAKAVLVGRPILWGLAVNGSAGIRHVLELLRDELDVAMALSGCPTTIDIDPSIIH
jgi:4-hydroxymandelate oxidase